MLWRFDANRNLLSPPEGQSPRDVFPKFPLTGVKAVYQINRTKEVIVFKGKAWFISTPMVYVLRDHKTPHNCEKKKH